MFGLEQKGKYMKKNSWQNHWFGKCLGQVQNVWLITFEKKDAMNRTFQCLAQSLVHAMNRTFEAKKQCLAHVWFINTTRKGHVWFMVHPYIRDEHEPDLCLEF